MRGLLFLLFLFGSARLPADDGFDRYQALAEHSPFAIDQPPALADGLYLASAYRFRPVGDSTPEGEKIAGAIIRSTKDPLLLEYVELHRTNEHGYRLLKLEWSSDPGQTTAEVSFGGKILRLSLNPPPLARSSE